ncbi:MAG: FlaD/FlaE family flagellar protein [Candidatus Methanoperedens sp.]
MFKDLAGKFELAIPEGSLIKKLERIKKTSAIPDTKGVLLPEIIEQLREEFKKTPEELNKKIEDIVNSKIEQIKTASEGVKNLEIQISKIEQIASSGKKSTEDFKGRLDKMDETVLELLSLYEVVSSTVNPFLDNKTAPVAEKMADLERKVEELSMKAPEMPSNLTQDIDNKFKIFENNMEELKKTVGSTGLSEDALVEKVTGQVLERIKPTGQVLKSVVSPPSQKPQASTQKHEEAPQYCENQGVKLPFLDNSPESSIILLNWIQFLLEKVGRNNLTDILEYYVDISWISEEVSSVMMDYAWGIDYYVERPTWKLLPEDHTKSLMFIEQLRGKKIDKNLISKLERNLDKIIRSSEIFVT